MSEWYSLVVDPENGYIETRFDDGTVCQGSPVGNDQASYASTAERAGYGANVNLMAVENDLLHSFLAERAGMPFSPTLWGTAHKRWWPWWEAEEAAVFALQCLLHSGTLEQWHLEALELYVKWCRPEVTIMGLVEEARFWLEAKMRR